MDVQLKELIDRIKNDGVKSAEDSAKIIIEEAEAYDRGFFTGVFGYFDGENLDSAVMIRFIEKQGDELIFKSGGGVTSFSECNQEYVELIDKVYVPIS